MSKHIPREGTQEYQDYYEKKAKFCFLVSNILAAVGIGIMIFGLVWAAVNK